MMSCVLILPASETPTGNAIGEAMLWGPNNYSVALSSLSNDPATYWGLRAWTDDDFQTFIENGVYLPELEEAGITEASYDAIMAALIYSFQIDATGHFDAVCQANDLKIVQTDDIASLNALL
jgi:hypothetical protein